MNEREITVGKFYRHFKGHIYKVIAIAYDSENYNEQYPNKSRLVIYEDIDRKIIWSRPYDIFNSLVDIDKYPNVNQIYRFEELERTDLNERK